MITMYSYLLKTVQRILIGNIRIQKMPFVRASYVNAYIIPHMHDGNYSEIFAPFAKLDSTEKLTLFIREKINFTYKVHFSVKQKVQKSRL